MRLLFRRQPQQRSRNAADAHPADATIARAVNILFASETEKAEFWLPLLQQALPQDRFLASAERSRSTSRSSPPRPPARSSRLKGVKLIQSLWMGVEKLLADPEYPRGVPLARLIDPGMVAAMSETVLSHVLDWHRHHYRYRAQKAKVEWRRYSSTLPRIAPSASSASASSAAMRRASCSRSASASPATAAGRRTSKACRASPDLEAMLPLCNALVCLLPLHGPYARAC